MPCRYFPSDVESMFCTDCLVPCSVTSASVGPHTNHTVRQLQPGLESYAPSMWSTEVRDFARCVTCALQAADEAIAAVEREAEAHASTIARLDAQIAELQLQRATAVESLARSEKQVAATTGTVSVRALHVARLGHHRIAHGLRHSLSEVFDADPDRYVEARRQMHGLLPAVHDEMRRLVDGLTALTADLPRSPDADEAAAEIVQLCEAAAPTADEVEIARPRKPSPPRRRAGHDASTTTDEADDDSNWCFHAGAAALGKYRPVNARPHDFHEPPCVAGASRRNWVRDQLAALLNEPRKRPGHSAADGDAAAASAHAADGSAAHTTPEHRSATAGLPRSLYTPETSNGHRGSSSSPDTSPDDDDSSLKMAEVRRLREALKQAARAHGPVSAPAQALAKQLLEIRDGLARSGTATKAAAVNAIDAGLRIDADVLAAIQQARHDALGAPSPSTVPPRAGGLFLSSPSSIPPSPLHVPPRRDGATPPATLAE